MAKRYAGERETADGTWQPVKTPGKKAALKVALKRAMPESGGLLRKRASEVR